MKARGGAAGGSRWRNWVCAGLSVVLGWGMPAGLQAEERFSGPRTRDGAGIKFDVFLLLDRVPEYGFAPVRLTVRNDSGKARSWNVVFTSGRDYDSGVSIENPHMIEVESGQSRTVDLLVPLAGIRDGQRMTRLRVSVSGYGIQNSTGNAPDRWPTYPTVFAGLSQSVHTDREGAMAEQLKNKGYPLLDRSGRDTFVANRAGIVSRGTTREFSSTALDFTRLPADWRSYSGMGQVQLTDAEWRDLPPAQRQALRDWMALGGRLVVIGAGAENLRRWVGFGGQKEIGVGDPNALAGLLVNQILSLDADPSIPWAQDYTQGWGMVKAVGPLQVNAGLIVGFVLLFGVIIAPVNLFIFAPARYRHRLFWTVPLISILASVLLGAVIILQDGFGGRGLRLAAVLLLPEEHKMAVVQEQVVKTSLLLGQQFALPEKVLLALVPTHREGVPDGEVTRMGDRAGGDWFSSRTIKGYQLKTILPTRARVEMVGRAGGGAPIVLSSLPVAMQDFFLIDAEGRTWSAATLPTGARTTLRPGENKAAEIREVLKERASENLRKMVFPMLERKGYFYGLSGGGDGIPLATLDSIRWKNDRVIYMGPWTGEAE